MPGHVCVHLGAHVRVWTSGYVCMLVDVCISVSLDNSSGLNISTNCYKCLSPVMKGLSKYLEMSRIDFLCHLKGKEQMMKQHLSKIT